MDSASAKNYRTWAQALTTIIVVPAALNLIVVYGFTTNYTRGVFHREGFVRQYEMSILRYRVLGRDAVLLAHDFLTSDAQLAHFLRRTLPPVSLRHLRVQDARADRVFYQTVVLINMLGLHLTSLGLWLALRAAAGRDRAPPVIRQLLGLLSVAMVQYVVVPYDTLACALLLLAVSLVPGHNRWRLVGLIILIVVGTLTRETTLFVLVFYTAWYVAALRRRDPKRWRELGLLAAAFTATYLGVRLTLGWGHAVWHDVYLRDNLSRELSLIFLMTGLSVTWLLSRDGGERSVIRTLVLLSVPYVIFMIVFADLRELRLWLPVWLSLLVLGAVPLPIGLRSSG